MDDSPNLKVRITQLYQPWTFSCGMVVEILDGSAQGAVQIVRVLGDNDILNADVRPENFIVSLRSDNEKEYYQVFMIDFGQSRVRGEHEPLSEWGRAKRRQDEEGAVGLVMQHRLRKLGVEIRYKPSLRYLEFAEREDE